MMPKWRGPGAATTNVRGMNLRSAATAGLAAVALFAAGCGDDDDETDAGSGAAATEQAAPETPPAETETAAPSDSAPGGTTATPPEPEQPAVAGPKLSDGVLKISTDTTKKPKVPRAKGQAPTELVVDDIVKGKGPAAQPGDIVTMDYVGVLYRNGEQFDASWDTGMPLPPFTLGTQAVIAGWDQGIVGMRAGGRRTLIIPPDLAYGDDPQGPGGPGQTLIFVVDLRKIGP